MDSEKQITLKKFNIFFLMYSILLIILGFVLNIILTTPGITKKLTVLLWIFAIFNSLALYYSSKIMISQMEKLIKN